MMNHRRVLSALTFLFCFWSAPLMAAEMKEWTFLTFLNGNNSLDQFGGMNIDQMKEVGSTDQVNVVVQWASMKAATTKRLYVKKGSYDVVEDMPRVDMGDYHQLVEFVRWGAQHYPAKHYFLNVWNHGGGWHRVEVSALGNVITPNDISWDDHSGHFITTEQLGVAMSDIAKILGQKVDIYGSDACLMAMAEVATEMKDSVAYFVGSEEVEPGEGWPYATLLQRWVANPKADGAEVSKILTQEYWKAYNGGVYGKKSITFSAMDLSKLDAFNQSVANLGRELGKMNAEQVTATMKVASSTQHYTYSDYKDVVDFTDRLAATPAAALDATALADVKTAVNDLVIMNVASPAYGKSHGIAVWIPTYKGDWNRFQSRYRGLQFNRTTQWADFLNRFFP